MIAPAGLGAPGGLPLVVSVAAMAVPTFLIAQQYVVSGAQPPEVWGQVIEELVAKAEGSLKAKAQGMLDALS